MEPSLLATLAIAFGLGLLHALDADHVMAVSALASRRPGLRRATLFCARWALGHAAAVLALGAVFLVLGAHLPAWVGNRAEQGVGVVLVLLGAWVFWDLRRRGVHAHVHAHDGLPEHAHWHRHEDGVAHEGDPHEHDHSAVLVGLLHGTAGSAPVIALVPVAHGASPWWGAGYLILFSLGVLVSMTLFGGLVGVCFERLRGTGPRFLTAARAAVATASIVFGLSML